jgi:hypothetical protein
VKLPSALTTTLPWLGPVASAQVLPPSPEGVSLGARVCPVSALSSLVRKVSSTATGRSSMGLTVRRAVAVETSPSASVRV